MATQLVSLIIPAFNEQDNLEEVFRRVTAVIAALPAYEFEMLLVDNASEDGTEAIASGFPSRDKRWRYIRFSRNFGVDVSLTAGLRYAQGNAVVILPSDLQDPPEYLPLMLETWKREKCDVVYGVLTRRSDESWLKTLGARVAYRIIHRLSDVRIPPDATDFRLITRPVVEALNRCHERSRYLRGLVHWVGFRQVGFPYERRVRVGGRSSAGLAHCINLAVLAVTAFSSRPLRWAWYLGALTTGLSALGMAAYAVIKVLTHFGVIALTNAPPGWATQTLLTFFFGGVQCLFIGLLGEYLGRVFEEVKQRPLWVLGRTEGFPAGRDPLRSGGVIPPEV